MALNQVPLSGQTLNASRPLIYANFITYIEPNFAVDHKGFNTGADSGKHNKVTFLNQSNTLADEPVATSSGFVVYDAIPNVAADANFPVTLATAELNLIRQGTTKILPFTASLKNTNGWTYLPSGILMKWGTTTVTRNTLTTITLPTSAAIPVFSAVYNASAIQTFSAGPTTGDLNTALCIGNLTTTTFQVFARANGLPSGSTISFMYSVIGIGPV